jgi:mannose-6-phosphate isomerase-like protein (cupin superfamily)
LFNQPKEYAMMTHEKRRKLGLWGGYVACLAALGVGQAILENRAEAQRAAAQGYVLSANEGETLVRPGGNIIIKVDPTKGSTGMAMGTQHLKGGAGIPVHQHEQDEILVVQEGGGIAIMGDSRRPIEKGTTIFIPKGVWHGVENTGDTHLLWIVTPPGLEGFFREASSVPGLAGKPLSLEQRNEIAKKHGTTFKP